MTKEVSLKQLQDVAHDINTSIVFDPPLNETETDIKIIREEIITNALELAKGDTLSKATKATLQALRVGPWLKDEKESEVEDDDKEPEVENEEELKLADGQDVDDDVDIGHTTSVKSEEDGELCPTTPKKAKKPEAKSTKKALQKEKIVKEAKKLTPKKETVKKANKSIKKDAPIAKKDAPKKEKKRSEKSRYGNRVGSFAAALDELLWKGTTLENAINVLAQFKKEHTIALDNYLRRCIWYVENRKNVPVKFKGGVYKASKATLK